MEIIGGIILLIIGIVILLFLLKLVLSELGYIWAVVASYLKPAFLFGLLGGGIANITISNFLIGIIIGGIIGLILKKAGILDTQCPDCRSKIQLVNIIRMVLKSQ